MICQEIFVVFFVDLVVDDTINIDNCLLIKLETLVY